ncbi:hypothetical protein BLOT_016214 [Blomia tropicalis]|nr:hypothetical protein BLOT_016214 [Blomia tropicalis]
MGVRQSRRRQSLMASCYLSFLIKGQPNTFGQILTLVSSFCHRLSSSCSQYNEKWLGKKKKKQDNKLKFGLVYIDTLGCRSSGGRSPLEGNNE